MVVMVSYHTAWEQIQFATRTPPRLGSFRHCTQVGYEGEREDGAGRISPSSATCVSQCSSHGVWSVRHVAFPAAYTSQAGVAPVSSRYSLSMVGGRKLGSISSTVCA